LKKFLIYLFFLTFNILFCDENLISKWDFEEKNKNLPVITDKVFPYAHGRLKGKKKIKFEKLNIVSEIPLSIGCRYWKNKTAPIDFLYGAIDEIAVKSFKPVNLKEVRLTDIKYIYILKWKNLFPKKIIKRIELISGSGPTTLFIFAITGGRDE